MKDKKEPPATEELPPWVCRTERDARELIRWTNTKLDELQRIANYFIHAGDHDPGPKVITEEQALEAAANGDMSLLQMAYPELAEHLRSSSRKRGRPAKEKHSDAIWKAVWDVKLIRRIWKKYFNKIKRPQNDRVNAEQIAAARWGVDVEAVCNRLKKLKQPFC